MPSRIAFAFGEGNQRVSTLGRALLHQEACSSPGTAVTVTFTAAGAFQLTDVTLYSRCHSRYCYYGVGLSPSRVLLPLFFCCCNSHCYLVSRCESFKLCDYSRVMLQLLVDSPPTHKGRRRRGKTACVVRCSSCLSLRLLPARVDDDEGAPRVFCDAPLTTNRLLRARPRLRVDLG